MVLNVFAILDIVMKKVKAEYETIMIGRKRIRFKSWPAEKCSYPGGAPKYVGVLTRVEPEMFDKVEKEISRNHKIKGIFYRKI